MGINSCQTGSRCSQGPRACLVSHPAFVSNNATSRAGEAACRVELVPTPRRATPGLERTGQQHIQHYQHPTDHYLHRQDTHTVHILLVQVCFQALRFWVYASLVKCLWQCHDTVIAPNPMFNSSRRLSRFIEADSRPGSSRTLSEDETNSEGHMRRITVSPPVSPRASTFDAYTYSDEDSVSDAAEVEAALALIDNELANTEDAVTEWSSRGSNISGPTSYSGRTGYTSRTGYTGTTGYSGETGYSEETGYTGQTGHTGPSYSTYSPSSSEVGSYSSLSGSGAGSHTRSYTTGSYGAGSYLSTDVLSPRSGPAEPHRLSTITERTENPSRPTSFQPSAGNRNSGAPVDTNRRSTHSSHIRAATDPTERVASPVSVPKRTGQLIAFFEEKTGDKPSLHARSTSVPSGPRSPSPFTSTYGYIPRPTSRPTSPTKPRATVNTDRLPVGDYLDYTPSTYTQTQTGVTGTYTAARTQGSYTSTTSSGSYSGESGNFSGFTDSHNTSSTATPASTLRRPSANRSPLSTVRNTINAWKESKPAKRDEKSTDNEDGLFSIRRRGDRGSIRQRDHALRGPRDTHSIADRELPATPNSGTGTTGGLLPPPFDVSELGNYVSPGGDQEVCLAEGLLRVFVANVPNSL